MTIQTRCSSGQFHHTHFVAALSAVGLAISLVVPGGAMAQEATPEAPVEIESPDKRAKDLYFTGKAAYDGGDYKEAARLFSEAYGLSQRPLLLLSLANAHERAENFAEALKAYEAYHLTAAGAEKGEIGFRIKTMKDRIAADAMAAELEAASDPLLPWAWTASVVGGATLIGGSVFLLLGELDHREVEDNPNMLRSDAQVLVDQGDDRKFAGGLVAGIGGGVVVTGAILFLLADTDEAAPEDASALNLVPTESGGMVFWRGEF